MYLEYVALYGYSQSGNFPHLEVEHPNIWTVTEGQMARL